DYYCQSYDFSSYLLF
nr:immunoglobulin light chain junction region [Macaca mulatta]MOW66651.1 immunoglobulin light chain junction region [Macaca mulatta]MOW68364.1 immunoglobulin light chain junction region [Macaca mulatta]MOW70394.1 immunoglobulin light chain junction region [Macaca mulatta]MOW70952.1 immunoglobulin light chain junction region [Macaca mulatta]